MKKIGLILTGGTIASNITNNKIDLQKNQNNSILKEFKNCDFEIFSPYEILSENANFQHLITLAEQINNIAKKFDAIIITHGTDTLVDTSAFLGLVFYKTNIPIIITASNYPLNDKRANGKINLQSAIQVISNNLEKGVYVCYKNPSQRFTSLHLATHVSTPSLTNEEFYSIKNLPYAKIYQDKIKYNNKTKTLSTPKNFIFNYELKKNGLFITSHNTLDFSLYQNSTNKPPFILVQAYHSGTINTQNLLSPTNSINPNFINFAKYCEQEKIDLYICNLYNRTAYYETTNQLEKTKVQILKNTLPHVAKIKLEIAYNFLPYEHRQEFLTTNINNEIIN